MILEWSLDAFRGFHGRGRQWAVFAVAVSSVLAASCGEKEPEFPENPQPSATIAPPPPVATTPPPPATTPCDGVQSVAFTQMIAERAKTEARGMEMEGGVVCGVTANEGGQIDGPTFFLQPNICYTVIANALPNVSELDVMLVGDASAAGVPPALATLLSQPVAVDSETGSMGGIGTRNNCFRWGWPIPVAVKVVLKSRTGAGPMGAQVYRKK